MSSQKNITESLGSLLAGVKNIGGLYIEKARLKTTEKITILLATVAYSAVVMALGLVCLVFVSIGIGHLLATTLAPHLAYLIIALFYIVVLVLVVMGRRQLFVDPIARFMSRLLVEKPEEIREAELMDKKNADAARRENLRQRIHEILEREGLSDDSNDVEPANTATDDENIN